MSRVLIIWIVFALVLPAFLLLRNKMTGDSKLTPVEVTSAPAPLPSPTTDAPKKRKSVFPEGFVPPARPPREFEYLPENKREAVKQAERDNAAEHKRRITPGVQDAAGIEEVKKLIGELDQRLSRILTPEEKFEYDLRESVVGQGNKSILFPMTPTDEESRAIFRHRQEFEKRVAENPSAIDAAWKEFDEKVRTSIGDERFKTYRMIHDATFIAVNNSRFGKRLEFETKCDLYRIQSAAGEAGDKIRLDDTLSTETKLQRLKELATNCISDMGEILGADAEGDDFHAYSKSLAVRMESLNPRSPRIHPRSLGPSPGLYIIPDSSDAP